MTPDVPADDLHVPPGHHYSPIPSAQDVSRALATAAATGPLVPGIDLRADAQLAMLRGWQERYDALKLPAAPGTGRFWLANDWFTYGDAVGLALMMHAHRPRRIVEVGCGHSSALVLDTLEQLGDPAVRLSFVDPDPQRLQELTTLADRDGRLHACPVQDAPFALFSELRAGDFLLIDSSHVVKAGSDVQYLFDRVLPTLPPGVLVHVHDVFYPFEYPAQWLHRGTAMNEAYFVRALLLGGHRYRIELFNDFLVRFHRAWFAEHMPLFLGGEFPTGGIWLRKQGQRQQAAARLRSAGSRLAARAGWPR